MRPMHTGIIANDWIDFSSPLDDKEIYCVEDESVPGSTHDKYTVSPDHLMVPTLGERMKAAEPATRVVRSEEHTSEHQSLMRSSYAVFCSKYNSSPTLHRTVQTDESIHLILDRIVLHTPIEK